MSSDTKQARDNRHPLDGSFVSLTEAATWVVEGTCRDDDYLVEHGYRALSSRGVDGRPNTHQQDKTIDDDYDRFYTLIRDECSAGRIILEGLEFQDDHYVSGQHAPIPPSFFLRPFFHGRGNSGTRLKGELGPDAVECCDAIVDGEDSRPHYGDIRIKREDVEKLAGLYDVSRGLTVPYAATKPRRGRKAKYDWEAFESAAVHTLDERGDVALPGDNTWNQAELERHMLEWCGKYWPASPSESQVRSHVSSALEAFRKQRLEGADSEGR